MLKNVAARALPGFTGRANRLLLEALQQQERVGESIDISEPRFLNATYSDGTYFITEKAGGTSCWKRGHAIYGYLLWVGAGLGRGKWENKLCDELVSAIRKASPPGEAALHPLRSGGLVDERPSLAGCLLPSR